MVYHRITYPENTRNPFILHKILFLLKHFYHMRQKSFNDFCVVPQKFALMVKT